MFITSHERNSTEANQSLTKRADEIFWAQAKSADVPLDCHHRPDPSSRMPNSSDKRHGDGRCLSQLRMTGSHSYTVSYAISGGAWVESETHL